LVIGRDTGGGGNTDTILLMAYDCQSQKLNVMSIPRDTLVNVSWDIKKINSVYNAYGAGEKGITALGKEIAQLVGFVPDFQVTVEWKALGELVDALGGVTYDVPRNMYYVDPSQDLTINIKKGVQKLSGSQAMQVVRFRDGPNGYANGDLGRIETQQGFLKAVVSQCLSIQNVTKINDLAKVFTNNVKTNLTINNLVWFADKAIGGLSMENVNFCTMPCQNGRVWSRNYQQKLSYVVPKTQELVSLVNESFNPYVDDLKSYELDIMYVNSDGCIGSSTGKLEDAKANTWVQTSSSTTSKKEEESSATTTKTSDDSSGTTQSSTTTPSQSVTTEKDTTKPATTDSDNSTENPDVVDGETSTEEPASESAQKETEPATETEVQPSADIPVEPYAMETGAGEKETVPE
jgi:LCP family protein required for cell wall assembly